MTQPDPSPNSSFHFILGPSLDAVEGCERKAIRSELIRRRCLQKKLRYQQEQMIKLDQLLKGSSPSNNNNNNNLVQNSKKWSTTSVPSPPPILDETNGFSVLDFADSPALTDSKSSPSSEPETPFLDTPGAGETSTNSNCLSCGGNLMCTESKDLLLGSYCICDTTNVNVNVNAGGEAEMVDASDLYPIPTRWYMPLLLDHFNEHLTLRNMLVQNNSIAARLQTTWLNHALTHPCAFHATLYSASAHLDMTRGKTSVITLWHETEMIRLVNLQLDDTKAAFNDSTLAAIISLACFTPFTLNYQSSQAHMNALLSMVNARGGLNALGLDGLLAGLIQLASFAFAVVFDRNLPVELGPPSPPTALLSAIIKQGSTGSCPTTAAMFQDMHNATTLLSMVQSGSMAPETVDWIIRKGSLQAVRKFHAADHDQSLILESGDHINRACQIAAIIFWSVLDQRGCGSEATQEPSSSVDLDGFLADLEATVAAVDTGTWLRTAPVVFSWVCLTAAAAAAGDMRRRAWFYFHQSHRALMAGGETLLLRESWEYFSWLRGLRRSTN